MHLVGGISVSHNTVGANNNAINLMLLEERSNHGVAARSKVRSIRIMLLGKDQHGQQEKWTHARRVEGI